MATALMYLVIGGVFYGIGSLLADLLWNLTHRGH